MNKQQEIQEMAYMICQLSFKQSQWNCTNCGVNQPCDHFKKVQNLYNTGYRKADEVQKEILKKLLGMINCDDCIQEIYRLAEELGVEVDE